MTSPSIPAPDVVLAATTTALVIQTGHMAASCSDSHDNDGRARFISTGDVRSAEAFAVRPGLLGGRLAATGVADFSKTRCNDLP
jgi:hypothetical protein